MKFIMCFNLKAKKTKLKNIRQEQDSNLRTTWVLDNQELIV